MWGSLSILDHLVFLPTCTLPPIFPKDGGWPTCESSYPLARAEERRTLRAGLCSYWPPSPLLPVMSHAPHTNRAHLPNLSVISVCKGPLISGQVASWCGSLPAEGCPHRAPTHSPGCPAQSPAQESRCRSSTGVGFHRPPQGPSLPT